MGLWCHACNVNIITVIVVTMVLIVLIDGDGDDDYLCDMHVYVLQNS